MRNIAVLVVLLATVLISGCAATKFIDTWKRPGFTGKVHKVYLIGVTRNDKYRKIFENECVRQLSTYGVTGVPSYPDLVISGDVDREALRQRLLAQGADAVLVARIASKEQRAAMYSGAEAGYTTVAPLNIYYEEYYNSSVTMITTGRTVESDFDVVHIKANLFDTETAQAVWSALIETTAGDSNREQRLREFVAKVAGKMQEDGLF